MIVTESVRFPAEVGVNVTETWQLAPADTDAPHVLVCAKFVEAAMLVKLRAAFPALVRVTACAELVVPTTCELKVRRLGARVTVGPDPVPTKAADCGLPVALSLIESVATREPAACGVKVTFAVQLAPAANDEPQVFVSEKSELLVPVMLMLVMVRAAFPVFTSWMAAAALLLPIACVEKF